MNKLLILSASLFFHSALAEKLTEHPSTRYSCEQSSDSATYRVSISDESGEFKAHLVKEDGDTGKLEKLDHFGVEEKQQGRFTVFINKEHQFRLKIELTRFELVGELFYKSNSATFMSCFKS